MNRECTPGCVAYCTADEMTRGEEEMALKDMHCIRLFIELADLIYTKDFEEGEEF